MQHNLSKLFDLSYCSVPVWLSIDLQKSAGLSNSRHIWGTKLESMILEDELRSNDDLITFHIIICLPSSWPWSSIWSPCTWSSAPVRLWPCRQPQTTRTSSVLSSRWRAPAQSWWGKWCQKKLGQNAVKILVSSHSATIAINVKEMPTLLW